MTDVRELDLRAHIEQRRAMVAEKLNLAHKYRAHARLLYTEDPTPENRRYLVMAMATCEVGEAEQEALSVEFM